MLFEKEKSNSLYLLAYCKTLSLDYVIIFVVSE
jgi:hypothetical protein